MTGLYIRRTDSNGSDACFAAPPSVSNFARAFDIGEPVAPFEFELELASPGKFQAGVPAYICRHCGRKYSEHNGQECPNGEE